MSDEPRFLSPPEPSRKRPTCPTCGAYGLFLFYPAVSHSNPCPEPRWIVADPEEMPEIDRLRHERDEARAVTDTIRASLVEAKAEADNGRSRLTALRDAWDHERRQVGLLRRMIAGVEENARAAQTAARVEAELDREAAKEKLTAADDRATKAESEVFGFIAQHAERIAAARGRCPSGKESLRLLLADALGALEDDETIILGRPSLDEVTPDGEIRPSIVSRIRTALAKSRPAG